MDHSLLRQHFPYIFLIFLSFMYKNIENFLIWLTIQISFSLKLNNPTIFQVLTTYDQKYKVFLLKYFFSNVILIFIDSAISI